MQRKLQYLDYIPEYDQSSGDDTIYLFDDQPSYYQAPASFNSYNKNNIWGAQYNHNPYQDPYSVGKQSRYNKDADPYSDFMDDPYANKNFLARGLFRF